MGGCEEGRARERATWGWMRENIGLKENRWGDGQSRSVQM